MKNPYDWTNKKNRTHRLSIILIIVIYISILTGVIYAQETSSQIHTRESFITAARELMAEAKYCALITVDETGQPQARTMYPFLPDDNMVVWLGTNTNSRKVREIRNNPRVTLYYQVPDGKGYVTIKGVAELVDDPAEKVRHFMPGWEEFYPDLSTFLPIKVTPEKLEIVSYPHQITGDEDTWEAPSVEFPKE